MTATETLDVLLNRLPTLSTPAEWIPCALEIGRLQVRQGEGTPEAIELACEVLKVLQQGDEIDLACVHLPAAINNLANLLFYSQQMYRALELLTGHQNLLLAGPPLEQRRALNLLGGIHQMLGDLSGAYRYYEQALQRTGEQDVLFRGKLLNNMGLLLQQQQKYPDALELLQEAEHLHRAHHHDAELALVLINQANVQLSQMQDTVCPDHTELLAGMDKLQEAQHLLDLHPSASLQVSAHDLVVRFLLKQGNLEAAEQEALAAREAAQVLHNEEARFHAELTLAEVLLASGEADGALKHLEVAHQGFQALGFQESLLDVLEFQVQGLKRLGRFEEALDHLQQMYRLDREIRNAAVSQQLEVMAHQRKVERIQHEAELERIRNAELEQLVTERMEEVQALLEKKRHLEEANQRMRELSERDGLTGVYNRRYLDEFCHKTFQVAQQQQQEFSVLILDIDNFKRINDRFSHQTGDEVLKKLADLLLQALRTSDVVARYGGEEFVVVMPHTGLPNAAMVAERIRMAVERHPWHHLHPELQVTLSLGVTHNLQVEDAEQMVHRADQALYHSKHTGKNRVTVFPYCV